MHLYIHIPFCKVACHYCDFHFSTNLSLKDQLIESIGNEIDLRKNYLKKKTLKSIYFGGGTPSLLSAKNFEVIFNKILPHFNLAKDAEITLEANPDDINSENLNLWKTHKINRLSIGIQSFNLEVLHYLNRSHNAIQAENCIKIAQDAGFEKFSIDLIYGIPNRNDVLWNLDLQKAMGFNIHHISAYGLTIEPNTVFGNKLKKGLLKPIEDEIYESQFKILRKTLKENNFDPYEISNFARNEAYAYHNTSYWNNEEYLGVGPAAHSYNKESRQFNISNNIKYIKALKENKEFYEQEFLSENDKANDYILTSLRTKWGIDKDKLMKIKPKLSEDFFTQITFYKNEGKITEVNKKIKLTEKGLLFADKIASDLFFI